MAKTGNTVAYGSMRPRFRAYIGIDYSGAGCPDKPQKGLQIYEAHESHAARRIGPETGSNWSRTGVYEYLRVRLSSTDPIIVGIDHSFSFPKPYMDQYGLTTWEQFLDDFSNHWPTDKFPVGTLHRDNERTGDPDWFRLTERWTQGAKSVFRFGVPGQVAYSSHAGIPWLHRLRKEFQGKVHFWPFDGFDPAPDKTLIAEVYPALYRGRVELTASTRDEQDAEAVATWLQNCDRHGILDRYFNPPLSEKNRDFVGLEGWILGVS